MTKGIFCLIAQATIAARKIQDVRRGVSCAGVSRTVIAGFAIGNTPHLTKSSDARRSARLDEGRTEKAAAVRGQTMEAHTLNQIATGA
jgi:hypothetical protein